MKIAEAEKEGSVNKDRQESMAFCGKLAVIYCTYTMEMRSDSLLSKGKGIRRDYIIMQLIIIPRAVGKLLCHFNQCALISLYQALTLEIMTHEELHKNLTKQACLSVLSLEICWETCINLR